MNELQIYNNEEFGSVRTITLEGEPYFVGKDVAEILGYADPNKAIAMHVDEDDKLNDKTASSLGQRGGWFINESGLYSLILSSKMSNAKKFKHWVTSEVLPSIRKHGMYATEDLLNNPDLAIKAFTALKEEREKNKLLQEDVKRMKPKEIFADAVSTSHTSILIGDLAKILKQNGVQTGQKRLFEWMRENGFLIKRNGADRNMPTQRAMEQGLFEVKESTANNPDGSVRINRTTKVTGKGQQYFINKFLSDKKAG